MHFTRDTFAINFQNQFRYDLSKKCLAKMPEANEFNHDNTRKLTYFPEMYPLRFWTYISKFQMFAFHYNDVIMGSIASQITSLTIVYSAVYSGVDQRKHQSAASLAFVWGIHRGPMNSPHKWPVTRNMFPFDDVIMFYMSSILIWRGWLKSGHNNCGGWTIAPGSGPQLLGLVEVHPRKRKGTLFLPHSAVISGL